MKLCAACHEDLPKDKYSKKQWKLGAQSQRRCTSCVQDNREVVQPPSVNNESDHNNTEVVSLLDSMSINDNKIPVSDEELFKQPPPDEDCPLCFLRMPSHHNGRKYMLCCGKVICNGCIYANIIMTKGTTLCPFCRSPNHTSNEERNERYHTRLAAGDAEAIFNYGVFNASGIHGYSHDTAKALELWHRAGKLGCAIGYYNIGNTYCFGEGVGVDKVKAVYYFELAAMGGHVGARNNLAILEEDEGNMDRALKHWMLAAGLGHNGSLKQIKQLFMNGHAKKEDYATALRDHQTYLGEVKSDQRDKAAAYSDMYNYY